MSGGSSNNNHNHPKDASPSPLAPRPNDCTYWVIPNLLLAGEYPAAKQGGEAATRAKLRRYLNVSGVTYFLDLTQPGERPDYYNLLQEEASQLQLQQTVQAERFAIPDFGIPSSLEQMTQLLDRLDHVIGAENRTAYVHCRGGIGRTGTVVACFLARYNHNQKKNNNKNKKENNPDFSSKDYYYTGDDALRDTNRLFQASDRSLESAYSPETREQMNFVKRYCESLL
ncbi:hypothetical protein ACA910_008750 [Epithemia clementina (nom. ined.)]